MAPPAKLAADDPTLIPSDEEDDDFTLEGHDSESSSDSEDDEPKSKKAKVENVVEPAITKAAIDDLWAEFNAPSPAVPAKPSASSTTAPTTASATASTSAAAPKAKAAMVKIKVKHTFVGETIEEDKLVPADSQEAIAYFALHSQKAQTAASSVSSFFPDDATPSTSTAAAAESSATPPPPPPAAAKAGPPKRKAGGLAAMAASLGGKPAKLTTLEKSKLDWNKFVDKEDLSDDLTKARKDGYLDKRDFLDKAQAAKEDEYDRMRKGGRR